MASPRESSASLPTASVLVSRTHHLGVAVLNMESALRVYEDVLGLRIFSGPFDDPLQRVRVAFIGSGRDGEPSIELIAPLGDDSPINHYLSRQLGAYHICYEVSDMEPTLVKMRANGCLLVSGPVPAVAFGGRRIAWVLLPSRHLVELLESPTVGSRGAQ